MAENHGYNTPAEGTLNWHVPLNENFRMLDRDVELRDANANRGNYTPTRGAKFLATDTGDVYIGDGSAWTHLGALGSGSAPTDELTQRLQAGYLVPVSDTTNAVQAVDSNRSTPLQDALDMLANAGGGTLHLPPTSFTEAEPVVLRDFHNISIRGTWGLSTVEFTSSGTDAHGLVFDDQTGTGFLRQFKMDGVTLKGPGHWRDTGYAIYDKGLNRAHFGYVIVEGWNNSAYAERNGQKTFDMHFDHLFYHASKVGPGKAVVDWSAGGAPCHFETITVRPEDYADVLYHGAGSLTVGTMNIGGLPRRAVYEDVGGKGLNVDYVNWEPRKKQWDPARAPSEVFLIESQGPTHIGNVAVWEAIDSVYTLDGASRVKIHQPRFRYGSEGTPSPTDNVVRARNLRGDCFYLGPKRDVNGAGDSNMHTLA